MDVETLQGMREEYLLLDVREPYEWEAGHLPDVLHIPMGQLNDRASEIPKDREIVCICRSGNRSRTVTHALNRAGWEAHNLEGGMKAWASAGYDFEAADGSDGTVA